MEHLKGLFSKRLKFYVGLNEETRQKKTVRSSRGVENGLNQDEVTMNMGQGRLGKVRDEVAFMRGKSELMRRLIKIY